MVGLIIGLKLLINSTYLHAVCLGSNSMELVLFGGLAFVSASLSNNKSVY